MILMYDLNNYIKCELCISYRHSRNPSVPEKTRVISTFRKKVSIGEKTYYLSTKHLIADGKIFKKQVHL